MSRSLKRCGFVLATLLLIMFAFPFASVYADSSTIQFGYTGAMQTWVVPSGVTSIDVDVQGAQGGTASDYGGSSCPGGSGGFGGRVQTTLSVTSGETLYIYVGGAGSGGSGGFNGGGDGGSGCGNGGPGGGGGGSSDIRRGGTALSNRIVIAGGGGGGKGYYDPDRDGPYGGGLGGGLVGGDGPNHIDAGQGGGGGTQTSGGDGGGPGNSAHSNPGDPGSLGQGGHGGPYCPASGVGGGGGGGGYYGGGGGGADSGGGGGGSSYSEGTDTIHTQGFQAGDGLVTISITEPTPAPDLEVQSISPVQVVYYPDVDEDGQTDLVAGKSTAVMVRVDIVGSESMSGDEVVAVRLTYEGTEKTDSKTVSEIKTDNRFEFYFVPNEVGGQTITACVDPENSIEESDETNNQLVVDVTVKDTRGLHVSYFRVYNPLYGLTNATEFSSTVTHNGQFMLATYPVAHNEFINEERQDVVYPGTYFKHYLGVYSDLLGLDQLRMELGAGDRVVGIVPDGYFPYHWMPEWQGAQGLGIRGAVIVEEGRWTVAAHEIGHTYGLEDEYFTVWPGNTASGFWVDWSEDIFNGLCFMGYPSEIKHTFKRGFRPYWICYQDYLRLFDKFRYVQDDPEAVLIGGILHKDGRVELSRWLRVEAAEIEEPFPGNYTAVVLDTSGQPLNTTSFTAPFELHGDPGGVVQTDVTAFSFLIPYPVDAATVRIESESGTLVVVNPVTKLLHDAVESIPDHGFAHKPNQHRRALHNKIYEVETKVENNDFEGAANKLEFDIRDKLHKWLVDAYQVESPLQMSKADVLGLVDDCLYRLRQLN